MASRPPACFFNFNFIVKHFLKGGRLNVSLAHPDAQQQAAKGVPTVMNGLFEVMSTGHVLQFCQAL